MGEDSERIVLARRKRGLAANNEVYLLLVNNDVFNAPGVSFSRNWVEIKNQTVSKMCSGSGVVHPIMLIVRRSGYRIRAGVSGGASRGSISKVEAEVEAKQPIEVEQDGGTSGTIDPSTKICTTDPSIHNRCFMLACKERLIRILHTSAKRATYLQDDRSSLSCLVDRSSAPREMPTTILLVQKGGGSDICASHSEG